MKSRITIEVDFENGNQPIIQIVKTASDDVRDKLLNDFIDKLGGQSNWCRIDFVGSNNLDSEFLRIRPLTPAQLAEEAKLMAAMADRPQPAFAA